jgi:hypothetical protein
MTNREKNARYVAELGGAMVIYLVALYVSIRTAPRFSSEIARTAMGMLPMLGVLLAIWAIVRHSRRVDEYVRQTTLEYISISAAVTAGWTMTYGLLEMVGFPRLSMFTVWPVMGGVWFALARVNAIRNR